MSVQFHKVADKYLALSFRSEGEPYLSLTSLAQPLISLRLSFGHSAFLSLVCMVCLKQWDVGQDWPSSASSRLLHAAEALPFFTSFSVSMTYRGNR